MLISIGWFCRGWDFRDSIGVNSSLILKCKITIFPIFSKIFLRLVCILSHKQNLKTNHDGYFEIFRWPGKVSLETGSYILGVLISALIIVEQGAWCNHNYSYFMLILTRNFTSLSNFMIERVLRMKYSLYLKYFTVADSIKGVVFDSVTPHTVIIMRLMGAIDPA